MVINSDHRPLEAITKKSLDNAPKRLQGMLLHASAYDVEVKYMEGKKMFFADMLSRAFLPAKNVQTQAEFETINAITFLPMREGSITKIRDETERDESLQTLKRWYNKAGHGTRPIFHILLPPTITSDMNLLYQMVSSSGVRDS